MTSECSGTICGCFSVCGAVSLNLCICKRERKTAIIFCLLGTCFVYTQKLYFTVHHVSRRTSLMINDDFDRPLFIICIVATLSQWNIIFLEHHVCPYNIVATTIGYSSMKAIDMVFSLYKLSKILFGQASANHFPVKYPPKLSKLLR